MGLRLFLVTTANGHGGKPVDDVDVVPFREIAAVVADAAFVLEDPTPPEITRFEQVIVSFAASRPVVPAPVGTVFRSRDTLTRWMELHYVTLTDALTYVEDRTEARVHISRVDSKPDEQFSGADLAAAAAESFRALRRGAVASVPLTTEHITGIVLGAAFLVDRELWKAFTELVANEREEHTDLRFDLSGPWPPYDFVRMQFGG
jgi:hypothetical protein